jgi:acetylornithine/succinyldiaminopimelate/putrescine aminotransferase
VRETGEYLLAGLQELAAQLGMEARGRGLLLGLDLRRPGRPLAEEALAEGFLLNVVQGNVLRFLPSFLLERGHVDLALEMLHRRLNSRAGGTAGEAARTLVSASA